MTANTTIHPDSPFRIGTSGKFKLLIKSVEEKFGDYEYLLIDADEKEYKAIAKALYAEGQILRCMVSFKVERARLVVENVAVCSKQDLATPVPVKKKPIAEPKPNSTPTHKAVSESKKKAREFIGQGAITINGVKAKDDVELKQTAIVKKGKNKFLIVK